MSSLGTYSNKIKVSRNSKVEKNDSLTNTVKLRSSSQNRATIDLSKSPVLNKKHADPHPPISDFENGLPKKSQSVHKAQISGGNSILKNMKQQPVNTKDLISSIHKNDNLLKNFGTSHNLYSSIYGLKAGAYDITNMKVSSVHRGTGSRNTAYTQEKKSGKFIKSAKINKEDLMGAHMVNNRSFNP